MLLFDYELVRFQLKMHKSMKNLQAGTKSNPIEHTMLIVMIVANK